MNCWLSVDTFMGSFFSSILEQEESPTRSTAKNIRILDFIEWGFSFNECYDSYSL
ncbi:hypothetical protein GCM10023183_13720 [Nibribacter koreensis]|uniref:Uncharacterized protein n=1 Tax=Nibribacter koreensis TaxID=1084519 RepID=A0ABP8FEX5_9BACT